MYRFTYPEQEYREKGLDKIMLLNLITKHRSFVAKLQKNKAYYNAEHIILSRERNGETAPNIKAVCNHAKDISDMASGYFMGNPITYKNTSDEAIEKLLEAFDEAEIDDVDNELALDSSIYGIAYEYVYAKEDESILTSKVISPENTFIVYDDSIEERELFAVYYYYKKNDIDDIGVYVAMVFTDNDIYELNILDDLNKIQMVYEQPKTHNLGKVPVIEYLNNKDAIGDFEQQIPLIDAYNTLMSDRVNDKEQFIDAILVLYGSNLGDDEVEVNEARAALKEAKLLELPEDAKAEYLTRSMDESGAEILRKAIKEDIYTFSHVPNLTDENFVGNSSGVALEYKLLGLEMITKIKERYFRKGLRKRILLYCNYYSLKRIIMDYKSIIPTFSRALPKDLISIAQTISNLSGTVSKRTLLTLLPFVEDPDNEIELLAEENMRSIKQNQEMFKVSGISNTYPFDEEFDEEYEGESEGDNKEKDIDEKENNKEDSKDDNQKSKSIELSNYFNNKRV